MRLFYLVGGWWRQAATDTLVLILKHEIVGDVVHSGEGYPPYRVTENIDSDSVHLAAARSRDGRWTYLCPEGTPVHLALAKEESVSDTYVNPSELLRLAAVADSLERSKRIRGDPDQH
jgi:hypothetical protein